MFILEACEPASHGLESDVTLKAQPELSVQVVNKFSCLLSDVRLLKL